MSFERYNPLKLPYNPDRRKMLNKTLRTAAVLATSPILLSFSPQAKERANKDPFLEALNSPALKGIAHNAANLDEYPLDQLRFDRMLASPAWAVELDVQYINGVLVVGHNFNDTFKMISVSPLLLTTHSFRALSEKAIESGKHLKVDMKDSTVSVEAEHALIREFNAIPEEIVIETSGTHWDQLSRIQRQSSRRIITAYTANGYGNNTWDNLVEFTSKLSSEECKLSGAALPYLQAYPERLQILKDNGQFGDVYDIESPEQARYVHALGARGITTNSIPTLQAIAE